MQSLNDLYGKVDNLTGLVHPDSGKSFRYMDNQQLIAMADKLTDYIITSGCDTIIVSETGASPLAEICEKIAVYKGAKLRWLRMKFPREPLANIYPLLRFYMSERESQETIAAGQVKKIEEVLLPDGPMISNSISREKALKLTCSLMPANFFQTGPTTPAELLAEVGSPRQSLFQTAVCAALEGTNLSATFARPFIYFDEYIDSGTTLRNAMSFFRCFNANPSFTTASYLVNMNNANQHLAVAHSLFDADSRQDGYELGAYPFENRLDLIGHFYTVSDTNSIYKRTSTSAIAEIFATAVPNELEDFFSTLINTVEKNRLINQISNRFALDAVRQFVTTDHLIRYCLFHLEKKFGEVCYAEFLFQLYDMYGPAWSPMPTSFHFDFWHGFEKAGEILESVPEYQNLAQSYKQIRPALLKGAADICAERRAQWSTDIHHLLEERYVYCKNTTGPDRALEQSICLGKNNRHIHGIKRENSSLGCRPTA